MNADRLERQRLRRKMTGNLVTRTYEKTKNGFLMRVYRNMLSRVTGVQKLKAHPYAGKPIISKAEFMAFSLSSDEFNTLFDDWKRSDHDRRLTPSIDRIDSARGYELDNLQWVTFLENCRRGCISKHMQAGHTVSSHQVRGEVIKV